MLTENRRLRTAESRMNNGVHTRIGSVGRLLRLAMCCLLLVVTAQGCKFTYSFTGAAIDPSVKTFSVAFFVNRARLVNPTLSQEFTEALQNKLQRQTSLDMLTERGDLEFSGQITGYETRPMNIQEGDRAAQTRLTVTVKVQFVNNKDPDQDWDRSFSQYADFDSSRTLDSVGPELMETIITALVEDIFNASIANW